MNWHLPDLERPFAAPFDPFKSRVVTAANIQLRQAILNLNLQQDPAEIVRAVLTAWTREAEQKRSAQRVTRELIAPRKVWQGAQLSEIPAGPGARDLNLILLRQRKIEEGYLLLDLSDPRHPAVKKLGTAGNLSIDGGAIQLFAHGGRAAWTASQHRQYF